MPKSKRNKIVTTSKATRKGLETKKGLVEKIQSCCDEYSSAYVFSVDNMRNGKIKDVRTKWLTSRFFFGKNRVMRVALGDSPSSEYKENLFRLSQSLVGHVGVMFTNKTKEEVKKWFESYKEPDFARSGNIANETVILPAGPLDENTFPHSMEPSLRKLGLPTVMQKGVIHLTEEYTVCKKGNTLKPEQCNILKLFHKQMVHFQIKLKCAWFAEGNKFETFDDYEEHKMDAEEVPENASLSDNENDDLEEESDNEESDKENSS